MQRQPETLEKSPTEEDIGDDCLPCRLVGASAFIGLGAYSYISGNQQLQQQRAKILKTGSLLGMKSRQVGIASVAATLVGLGVYRLVN